MPEIVKEPAWFRNFKGIACGTTAGIAVTLIGHPFDTLKVRLQTQSQISPIYSGTFDCIRKTIKWEGISGLYKGVISPISGQIVFRTSLFTTFYESIFRLQNRLPEGTKLRPCDYFLAGLITGSVASFSDAPIELFKSKMQYQIISERLNKPLSMKYTGVLHCLKHTYSNHGVRGIFQGLGPTFIRDSIGYCLYFGSFECMKHAWTPPGSRAQDLSLIKLLTCGGIAGCVFWTSVYNIDVIKSAMMADDIDSKKRKYRNMVDCYRKLYINEGGYGRFWRGYFPCIMRAFIANALMLYIVDATRKIFPSYTRFSSS